MDSKIEILLKKMEENNRLLSLSKGSKSREGAPPNWPKKFPLETVAEFRTFEKELENETFQKYAVREEESLHRFVFDTVIINFYY